MTHPEYWATTPAELMQRHDGYLDRRDARMSETAWALAHVMSMWSKKPVRPDQIFRPRGWIEQQKRIKPLNERYDYEAARKKHRAALRAQGVAVPDDGLG